MMKNVDKNAPDYREQLEEFLNFVDKAVQTFAQSRLRIDSFFLHVRGVHACSFPLINAWLPFALRSGLCQLTFRAFLHPADQRIPHPLSGTTFSTNSSAGSSKFFNLQRLILFDVNVSEKIIRDITSNCPNITELVFWRISGVKNIEISKLNKLEWLEMSMVDENKRVVIDAPSLLHFRCQDFMPWVSDLKSCLALKDLEVEDSEIIDEEIGVLMSRFPGLEAVTLTSCQDLEKVRISHLQLKSLKINHCSEIESIFINAPSLSKFTYEATIVKFPQLSSKFVRGNVDVIYNLDAPARVVLDSSKFVDLRRFLEIPTRLKYLTISFFGNEVCFDSKAAGEDENPTLVKVDHLELKCQTCIDRSAALLEGVFWSCRPKIISFATIDHVEISLQKILCEKLLRSEDRSCCKGTKRMCWHHGLKAAKIDFCCVSRSILGDSCMKYKVINVESLSIKN